MPFSSKHRYRLLTVTCVVLVMMTFVALCLIRMTQHVPKFYTVALKADLAPVAAEITEGVPSRLADVRRILETEGAWSFNVSDADINRWLASDLKKRLPICLPQHASDPRIKIQSGKVNVACQYDDFGTSLVLSMIVEPMTTDKPNELAVKIRNPRVGAVPGLMDAAVEKMRCAAWRARLSVRWQQDAEETVAFVQLPRHLLRTNIDVTVESIEFMDGRLRLTGKTVVKPPTLPPKIATKVIAFANDNPSSTTSSPIVHVTRKPIIADTLSRQTTSSTLDGYGAPKSRAPVTATRL